MTITRITSFISLIYLLSACSAMDTPEEANNMAMTETADYNYASKAEATESYQYNTNQSTATANTSPSPTVPLSDTYQQVKRVLIQRAESRIEVENMSEKVQRIEQLLTFYGGYLSDMNAQQLSYRNETVMSIRIPADRFHTMLDSVRTMAVRIEHESIHAEDVTEEFVDIQSRLKTKKQVRDRYEDILRTKAKTVEEVLLAEEKIRRLQEEIEAKEGRLRYLANRSSLSQIQLSMYEKIDQVIATESPVWYSDFLNDTKQALGFGFGMVRNLFLAILGLWPILLIIFWLIYKRKRIRAFFSSDNKPGKVSSE